MMEYSLLYLSLIFDRKARISPRHAAGVLSKIFQYCVEKMILSKVTLRENKTVILKRGFEC